MDVIIENPSNVDQAEIIVGIPLIMKPIPYLFPQIWQALVF
jgi:hypothetical protein